MIIGAASHEVGKHNYALDTGCIIYFLLIESKPDMRSESPQVTLISLAVQHSIISLLKATITTVLIIDSHITMHIVIVILLCTPPHDPVSVETHGVLIRYPM